jgi:hypothetical protein
MTDSLLGQSARPTRLGRAVITGANGLDRFAGARVKGRYSIDLGELRRRLENVGRTSASREFATGFVDFLLGRGARHS